MASVSTQSRTARILLLDADAARREGGETALRKAGHVVRSHGSLGSARSRVENPQAFDLVLADADLPAGDRAGLASALTDLAGDAVRVVFTARPTTEGAITALRGGLHDYLVARSGTELVNGVDALLARMANRRPADADLDERVRELTRQNTLLTRKVSVTQRNLREQMHLQQRSREVFYTDLSRVMAIFDNLVDGIVFTGRDGKVILVNPAAGEMLEVQPFSTLGKPLTRLSGTRRLLDVLVDHRSRPLPEEGIEEEALTSGRITGDQAFTVHTSEVADYQGKVSGVLSLLRDVTARKKTEQLKNQFLSIVAHELRTPLTAIKAFATILDQGISGPLSDAHRPLVRHMLSQSDRLGHEIDKIICLGRLESSDFAPDLQPLTAPQVLQTLLSPFDAEADKKNIELRIRDDSGESEILADLQDLRRAIRAIVENALKFTPESGAVELRVRREDDEVVFEVADTGIGIDPVDHRLIFEKFMQLENPLTRKYGGSGLGLSFAAEIVEAHGSSIEVESELGRGAKFRFRLPVRDRAEGPVPGSEEEGAPHSANGD